MKLSVDLYFVTINNGTLQIKKNIYITVSCLRAFCYCGFKEG
jgi:hypothetical protein